MRDYPSATKDQDQFDLLLATTHAGLRELDVRTNQSLCNLRHDNIFGYPNLLDDWSAEIFLDHVLECDRDRVQGLLNDAITCRSGLKVRTETIAKDGLKKWINVSGLPKFGNDGEMQKLLGHVIDITKTKESEERQRQLAREMNHSVRNTQGVIRSMTRLIFRGAHEKSDDFLERLSALSDIHDMLQAFDWQDVDLKQIVDIVLTTAPRNRVRMTYPKGPVRLSSNAAVTFAMAVHELYINSLKYGSLRSSEGAVDVEWNISELSEEFVFTWKERNGPSPPRQRTRGYGETTFRGVLPSEIDVVVDMNFAPEGLTVTAQGRRMGLQPE